MRSVLKTGGRRWNLGWLLPLVLLALPNCFLSGAPFDPDPNAPHFSPGENPTSAIMCEIPVPPNEEGDECATDEEMLVGIPMEAAATALANSQNNPIMLDFSDAAQDACGEGRARRKEFYGTWPDGLRVCLNCGLLPNIYASPAEVCAAKCQDLLEADELLLDTSGGPYVQVLAFCQANAKVAINVAPETICYEGACQEDGKPNAAWVDPRRSPEPVKWVDHIGTTDNGGTNDLERSAPTTGGATEDFNAGAASAQTTALGKNGDGWVEFSAAADPLGNATDKVHVLGLRESFTSDGQKCFDVSQCPDTDPHLETVGFAIDLNSDGQVYVLEPDPTGVEPFLVFTGFGPYTEGQRFRVKFTDNRDGTASISYARMNCTSGPCVEDVFKESTGNFPKYPLRVDTTFREQDARINNVTIVRIK